MNARPTYDDRPWLERYGAIPRDLTVRHAHLAALVREASVLHRDRIAFTTCLPNGMHASLTYGEVERRSDDFATWLREGVKLGAGARVALQAPNSLAWPVVAFGVLKAGCVLVNVNPLYTPPEMEKQLADAGAEVLVIFDSFANKLEGIRERLALKAVVTCEVTQFFSPVPRAVARGVMKVWNRALPRVRVPHLRLADALRDGEALRARLRPDLAGYVRDQGPGDVAVLQYTGGTTGVSKGAMLTHGNLLANVAQIQAMGTGQAREGEECVLTALPLYHVFAFSANLLAFYAGGGRNVLVPSPRPIQNLRRAFETYPITWVTGVNTLFNALLNEEWFTAFPPRTLRAAIAGGTALQRAVAERWEKVTGAPIAEGYGLTEASPVVCFNPLSGRRKPGSIGVPVPGTEVRLVDDDGVVVPTGQPGELVVRGPQVMAGYWNRPDETARTIRDGWLHTGDVAVMDEEGDFRIVDRKKDLVVVSGFKVFPNEVEDAIAAMDEVLEVAVIGVPDPRTGEAVRAYVVSRDPALTEARVREHCRGLLTDYKVPRSVVFRSELPKTPVGKVLRKELRAELAPAAAPVPLAAARASGPGGPQHSAGGR